MTDYSFMKTGLQTNEPQIDDDLIVIISLFTQNAIENAMRHVELCNRNDVTCEDMVYAMKYEVFEFFNRTNITCELSEIKNELEEYYNEQDNNDDNDDYSDCEDDSNIVSDSEIEQFQRLENFKESTINKIDKEFIEKYYKYTDSWDDWIPETPIEKILKSAINKTD